MEIHHGYKCLNSNYTNSLGLKFNKGKIYSVHGKIIPGAYDNKNSNGYHMSENLANIFRYTRDKNPVVAEVTGFGECVYFEDSYYGYYDMYVCENLKIEGFLKREDIIKIMLHKNQYDIIKFLSTYKLSKNEITQFLISFNSYVILRYILYYQCEDEDAFYDSQEDVMVKVNKIRERIIK